GARWGGGGHRPPPPAVSEAATRVLLGASRGLHHPIDGQEGVKGQFHGAPFRPERSPAWRRTDSPLCHESSRRPRQLGGSFAAVWQVYRSRIRCVPVTCGLVRLVARARIAVMPFGCST